MANRPRLAIRADGGPTMGVGHLARTLALVQAWCDRHGDAVLVSRTPPAFWADQFRAEGCAIVDPDDPPDADWWVVDGYGLGGAHAAPPSARVAIIDDHDAAGTAGAGAEVVIDQNLRVDPTRYARSTLVLSGPRYALLRRAKPAEDDEPTQRGCGVVVIFGGAPSPALIALGTAVEADPRLGRWRVRFLRGTDRVEPALAGADLAIAAAGTIAWEICRAGVPSVLVAAAENQEPVARELDLIGAARWVSLDLDEIVLAATTLLGDGTTRQDIARSASTVVDGRGARRVACRLRAGLLELRAATRYDAGLLHAWSNDPVTREASFSPDPIPWANHIRWFEQRLADAGAATLIATDHDGAPVGLVRFDASKTDRAEIGITVAPDRRRSGWGGALIAAGTSHWQSGHPKVWVNARIKPSNRASARAFEDADYDAMPDEPDGVLRYARRPHDE